MSTGLPDLLDTERLLLRAPTVADAAGIFASYTQDPIVTRYMMWRPHALLEETSEFIAGCVQDWQGGQRRPYILTPRDAGGQPIGMLEARMSAHVVELGYVLGRAWWRQGLMPEAVRALTAAVLALPPVFRVQAVCDMENRASARVLEKAGFVREGRLERCTVHPNLDPEPRACSPAQCRCRADRRRQNGHGRIPAWCAQRNDAGGQRRAWHCAGGPRALRLQCGGAGRTTWPSAVGRSPVSCGE
jgi:RimJ/RimL family protein N-acetyltransferase